MARDQRNHFHGVVGERLHLTWVVASHAEACWREPYELAWQLLQIAVPTLQRPFWINNHSGATAFEVQLLKDLRKKVPWW
jgi:hypothetical protein